MRRSIEAGLVIAIAAWALWMWVERDRELERAAEARSRAEQGSTEAWVVETPMALLAVAETGIAGRVVAADGAALRGAQVCALPAEALAIRCIAAGDAGEYSLVGLAPGAYRVSASASGSLPVQHSPAVILQRGELREGLDLVLGLGGAVVHGVVRDVLGGTIAGAVVISETGGHALSDEAGLFTLWAAPESAVTLEVSAAGYATEVAIARPPQSVMVFALAPESVLRGQVVRAEGGGPLVGLGVQVEAERVAGVSDEDGSFEVRGLAAGSWRPFVRDEGWCGEVATSVVLGPGETSERVTIAARRCPVVQGEVVVMGSGAGCGAAQVELLDAVGDVTRRVLADAGGQVALSGVEPGAYAVRVRCPGHLQRAPAPLWVGDTGVQARWEVEAGRTVRGRVVDANGVVVPRARVEVVGPLGVVVADADDAGNFVVKGVSPGASRVRPYHPQQGEGETLEQEIAEGLDPPPMQLKFAASATIRGQVRALGGPLPANLTVVARALTGRGGKAVRVGEDGRYAVSGVTRAPHRVVVQRAPELVAAKVAGELVAAVEVDLRAGDVGAVDFEVVAARLVTLTGRVEDANGGGEAGAVVTVSDTRIRERAQTDESGRFAVLVEEGATYTVTATSRAGAELVAVDVAPGAELVLKAAGISGSSGRATRRGGPRK